MKTFMFHVTQNDYIFTSFSIRHSRVPSLQGLFMISEDKGSEPWGTHVQCDGMQFKDAFNLAGQIAQDESVHLNMQGFETTVERNFADSDIPI